MLSQYVVFIPVCIRLPLVGPAHSDFISHGHQPPNWGSCPGGAKPACTRTLEGQNPDFPI